MYDDHDDADDVNRTPTAFARRNYQQPESYKSSFQKYQAYHGHMGKTVIGPGFDKSIAESTMQRHRTSKHLPCHLAQNLVIPEVCAPCFMNSNKHSNVCWSSPYGKKKLIIC